jgi:hypothetical protein
MKEIGHLRTITPPNDGEMPMEGQQITELRMQLNFPFHQLCIPFHASNGYRILFH